VFTAIQILLSLVRIYGELKDDCLYSVLFHLLTQLTSLKKSTSYSLKLISLYLGTCFLAACGTPKDTAMSRGIQNLTARYNYIYNANVILEDYEETLHTNYKDNYNEILPVYTTPEKFSSATVLNPPVNEKALDAIITKSQAIIADKAFSNYIDESYLLLGKANYLKTYYFVAEEYFDYTLRTYPANTPVQVNALNWKARSLMQLNNVKDAALVLDTLYATLPMVKNHKAEPLATIAQMYIYQERYDDAVLMLENAIKLAPLKRNRIRWTYILAQLYEMKKNYQEALRYYVKVQKSNAGFELYFNANLNRIKIEGLLNGQRLNRKKQLAALLRDDKNLEYIDQIYYQIAESHAQEGNFREAAKYYQLSVRNSNQNKYQKGLSYLRMADLNFKELKNFVQAKLYYDSTVTTLPPSYPGYAQVVKKSQNLEYLTTRYETVAFEDTLQLLAKLPEEERLSRIRKITALAPATAPAGNTGRVKEILFPDEGNTLPANTTPGTFYFNNRVAIDKGYGDFLIRWGNRKAEDNWRQSVKSSAQTTTEAIAKVEDATAGTARNGSSKPVEGDSLVARYEKAMPINDGMVTASNQKIIDAYFEIANFYQQELEDQQEAVKVYELILNRFPDNNHLAAIYYGLSLAYQKTDEKNTLKYQKLVLEKFPQSIFAKTILDPDYSSKQSLAEAAVIKKYNDIFTQYEKKAFPAVISEVNAVTGQYPGNLLNPQLSYLKAIAIGRTRNVDSLNAAFNGIVNLYPDDQLITPLVKDHLAYIAAHLDEFKKRKVALPDFDMNEPRIFASQPLPVPPAQQQVPALPATEKTEPEKTANLVPAPVVKTPENPIVASKIFSTEISKVYYYVIDVEDASLTLSSSRFGIGQFNRGNYGDAGLRHQLTEFDNDQLIYVGNFSSFAEAKSYSDGITPQLRQIMKVPANIYKNFIISKENFEKIQSKDLVTKYLDFYNNNYQ
jgi:tetratricopeptide (TPR) repeat protein